MLADDIFRFKGIGNLSSSNDAQGFAFLAVGIFFLFTIPPFMLVNFILSDCNNQGLNEDQRKKCQTQKTLGIVGFSILCWFLLGIIIYSIYSLFRNDGEK
jgi:hypothetical protein